MKNGIKTEELRAMLSEAGSAEDMKKLLFLILDKLESQEKEIAALKKIKRDTAALSDRLDIMIDTIDMVTHMALGEDDFLDEEEEDTPVYPENGQPPVIGIWKNEQ